MTLLASQELRAVRKSEKENMWARPFNEIRDAVLSSPSVEEVINSEGAKTGVRTAIQRAEKIV